MSNYRVNGHTINSIADFDALLAEIDTKTMQLWNHPLPIESLRFLLHRIKEKTENEGVRIQIDERIRRLSQNDSPNKELEAAQQERDKRLRSLGFDVEVEDDNAEPTEEMKATWKKREKRQEMYER